MKKSILLSAILSTAIAMGLAAAPAFAMDDMKKDSMNKEHSMSKKDTMKDTMKKDSMSKKDSMMKKDSMSKDDKMKH